MKIDILQAFTSISTDLEIYIQWIKKLPHLQSSLLFVMLMLKIFALQPQHQTLKYSLRVPNGWLSVVFLYSLATVQPHNGYELNTEVFESLCYDKTSASSFGTAHDKKDHQHSIAVIKTWGVGI